MKSNIYDDVDDKILEELEKIAIVFNNCIYNKEGTSMKSSNPNSFRVSF